MTTRAFQKIYTKIENITKATVTLRAEGVGNDELATVGGKLAQVVKIMGDQVTLQVFAGTEGITTDSEVIFHGEPPKLRVSDNLAGRFFNAYGEPIEGGEQIEGEAREIGGPTVNPFRRIQPSELIATGIAGIDLNNTIVTGQKIPFFADPDQPYNAVMANVALRAKADKIILGGMGLSNDDFLYFKQVFENAGALDRIVSFVNTTENPPVERLLVPDMALTAAEYFAVDKGEKVLVLLTDMTLYADAANAKTKLENGFDLSDYDERALKFAYDYSEKLLAIDVNIEITQMLDTAWELFAKYFSKEEVAIKSELVEKYWPKTE